MNVKPKSLWVGEDCIYSSDHYLSSIEMAKRYKLPNKCCSIKGKDERII